jgi:hypothetical protein
MVVILNVTIATQDSQWAYLIHIENVNSSSGDIINITDIAKEVNEHFVKKHNQSSKCEHLNLDLKYKKMLIITMDGYDPLIFSKKISLLNTNFEVLAFSSVNSSKIVTTTFNFKEQFYTAHNGSIPEVANLSELQKIDVILLVKEGVASNKINHTEHIFKKRALDGFKREA